MKMTGKETTPPALLQPVFHKVADNLYRLESSGAHYALVEEGGKQFRRSLKTKDRKLAVRRLKDMKGQVGSLAVSDDAKLGFEVVAIHHNERGYTMLFFVRSRKKMDNITSPFTYLGSATLVSYQSECPVQMIWRLNHPIAC